MALSEFLLRLNNRSWERLQGEGDLSPLNPLARSERCNSALSWHGFDVKKSPDPTKLRSLAELRVFSWFRARVR
jgi:hypothetical protein